MRPPRVIYCTETIVSPSARTRRVAFHSPSCYATIARCSLTVASRSRRRMPSSPITISTAFATSKPSARLVMFHKGFRNTYLTRRTADDAEGRSLAPDPQLGVQVCCIE
jgi:hypothetical protein